MSRHRIVGVLAFVVLIALVITGLWWWSARRGEEPLRAWEAAVMSVAGTGIAGIRDGTAHFARFSDPFGVGVDSTGAVYVSDAGQANRIRRIATDGTVSTIAGGARGFADGAGPSARFDTPSGLAVGPDDVIYVADTANNAIRRVTRDGIVSTIAGDGIAGHADGPATLARFNGPIGVAIDAARRVIVADTYNDRIRAIESDGVVVTLAGDGQPGLVDGPGWQARFNTPSGVAVDTEGNVYVADTGNDAIRKISPSGEVSTVWAATGVLYRPTGIAIDDGGTLYVSEERGRIVEITPEAAVRILAGWTSGFADGPGPEARFRAPSGVAFVTPRRLLIADRRNAAIRAIADRTALEFRAPGRPRDSRFDAPRPPSLPLLWPFTPFEGPFEVTGTFGEARGTQSERFHSGLDIHGVEGTYVHAVRDGVVSDPLAGGAFGTLNEWFRVDGLTYVHLRVGRERRNILFEDPRFVYSYDPAGALAQVRVKRGSRFATGEPIGTVNQFSHVHLNVGWPGEEVNPLELGLVQFVDTVPPTIPRAGIRLIGEDGQPLKDRRKRRLLVSGRVRIVVDAWDQVDGNAPRRRLGLYRLGYQILHSTGAPASGWEMPLETIRFDRLAVDSDAARHVYASGTGIPEYGRRSTHFLYVVTTTLKDGIAKEGTWDADALPPGDYIVRILAADFQGNEAVVNRDLAITIAPAGAVQ